MVGLHEAEQFTHPYIAGDDSSIGLMARYSCMCVCKGTLLFSPIPPVPLPSSSFLSLFLHPTDSYLYPLHSLSFPFLSASLPPTPFASEPRPVTPKSSRTSDSLGLARTRLYTSGLVRATITSFPHFVTLHLSFPRPLARLWYIPLPLHYHMPPRTL